jgi:hypothetical protein
MAQISHGALARQITRLHEITLLWDTHFRPKWDCRNFHCLALLNPGSALDSLGIKGPCVYGLLHTSVISVNGRVHRARLSRAMYLITGK